MNPFEDFTVMIGLLAIALESVSYVRDFVHKWLH